MEQIKIICEGIKRAYSQNSPNTYLSVKLEDLLVLSGAITELGKKINTLGQTIDAKDKIIDTLRSYVNIESFSAYKPLNLEG